MYANAELSHPLGFVDSISDALFFIFKNSPSDSSFVDLLITWHTDNDAEPYKLKLFKNSVHDTQGVHSH